MKRRRETTETEAPEAPTRRVPWELLALAVMCVAFFGRFLFTDRVLLLRDLVLRWNAWQTFYRDCLLDGVLPLWNPYTGCGEPFLADIQTATLYPLSLIFLLFPVGKATAVGAACHVFIACAGTYTLCRLWRVSTTGSTIAAMAFGFGAMMLTRIEFYAYMASAAWFPVVLAAFTYWTYRPSAGRLMLTPVALSLQLLAGYPEAVFYAAASLLLYALFVGAYAAYAAKRWQPLAMALLGALGACVLTLLLTAVQVLPTWEAQRLSYRVTTDPELHKASVNLLMLWTMVFPFLYGTPGHLGRYWAPSCYEYWVPAMYIGLVPVVILFMAGLHGAVALLRRKGKPKKKSKKRTRKQKAPSKASEAVSLGEAAERVCVPFLVTLAAASFLYAMGRYTPFFKLVWHAVPLLRGFRWPTKSLMCFVLATSCLAGIGLDRLAQRAEAKQDGPAGWRRFVARWGTMLVFGLLSLACVACLARDGYLGEALLRGAFNLDAVKPELVHRIEWQMLGRECVKLAVLAPAAAMLVWAYVYIARWRSAAGWLLVGVLFVDLFLISMVLLPSGSGDVLKPDPEYDERFHHSVEEPRFLEHDVLTQFWLYGVRGEDVFRLARSTRGGSWAIADRIFAVHQNSSLFTGDFLDVIGIYLDEKVPWEAKQRLLRMMNCDTVVRFPDVFAYLKDETLGEPQFRPVWVPLPRAYVVGGMEVQPEHKNVLGYLVHAEFDPLAVAGTDEASVGNATFYDLEKGQVEHTVDWVEYDLHQLELEAHCERPGLLVLSEAYYPGWRATVNGQDAPIYKVNGAFRGVRVDAGANTVVMVYRPMMLRIGWMVSIATAVECAAGLYVWSHRGRRTTETG